jgi:hypothetical protein
MQTKPDLLNSLLPSEHQGARPKPTVRCALQLQSLALHFLPEFPPRDLQKLQMATATTGETPRGGSSTLGLLQGTPLQTRLHGGSALDLRQLAAPAAAVAAETAAAAMDGTSASQIPPPPVLITSTQVR